HLSALSQTLPFMLDYKNPNLIVQSDEVEAGSVTWHSPANLAILKYWGKHGTQLPRNPSFSLTLNSAFTETQLEYAPKESGERNISLEFLFAGEPNEPFRERVLKYLESVADIFPFLRQLDLTIHTANSFPHSAGIASSASAMSALALCLCTLEATLFDTLDDDEEFDRKASFVARLGSGSACRSIFSTGAIWGETGDVAGSSDLFAVPMEERMHDIFKTFHDDVLLVNTEAKSVSSRAGHSLMENHPFADGRYQDARRRLHFLLGALKSGDVEEFGRIAENEALTLHGLMMSSNPSFILLKSNTLQMIDLLRKYRQETKMPIFFSLDAGPNLHVLYPEEVMPEVREFITDELIPLCEEEQWLQDWVGEGPVEV
ncbi:MAG: diphosphomevalonate decarboxylase, partial [Bacteroidota bacterium]